MSDELYFDPRSPDLRHDPVALFESLRVRESVFENPNGTWGCVSYKQGFKILREPKLVSKATEWRLAQMKDGPFKTYCVNTMAFMDGDKHKRTRAALAPVFGPANIKKLTEIIETICDELIASLEGRDSFDFMKDFATNFPLNVVCEILGIPREHHEIFGLGSQQVVAALEPMAPQEILDRADAACAKMAEILGGYADERNADKDGDLISFLKAQHEAGILDHDEFINHMIFVMVAGHETTSTLMSYAMNHLLDNPQIADDLRDDPTLTQNAVSEFLRLYPPLQFVMRYTEEAIEVDGITVPENKMIFVGLGGANRDPEMFPDPHTCNVRRKNAAQHLAFIAGPHTCLGNNLARLETKIAFEKLLKQMPRLQRDGDAVPNTNFLFQGYSSLPVRKMTAA